MFDFFIIICHYKGFIYLLCKICRILDLILVGQKPVEHVVDSPGVSSQ